MDVIRFGPGFRRPTPPTGTQGLADQIIWSDPRARISELAFSRRAVIPPQTSPDEGLFIVVSGGGWVQVGDERASINHGEAVVWPSGLPHGAWTDGSEMRAILVELPDEVVEAGARRLPGERATLGLAPAKGRLAERQVRPEDHDPSQGEPW